MSSGRKPCTSTIISISSAPQYRLQATFVTLGYPLAYRHCKKDALNEDQPKQCQWEEEVAGVQLWLCFCRLITLASQLLYRLIRRKPLHP